jgi:hypothetical protein
MWQSARPSSARASAPGSTRRFRPWRAFLLATLSVLTLILVAGCGGEAAPSGYLCGLGRSPTDNGCYREAVWATSDTPPAPFQAVETDVLVVPISCVGDCLRSANNDPAVSGGASATGGVFNYVELSQPGPAYFIRLGYGAIAGDGTPTYFAEYRLPVSNADGSSISPQYRRLILTPTGVPPAPAGGYRFTRLQILGGTSGGDAAGPFLYWYACLSLPDPSRRSGFADPRCTLLNSTETRPDLTGLPIADSFDPNRYSVGEHVYGFSGATADEAAFTNTRFSLQPADGYSDHSGAQEMDWHISTNDVSIQASTPAPVPFAGWLTTPAQSPSNGGMFSVECCRPLHS